LQIDDKEVLRIFMGSTNKIELFSFLNDNAVNKKEYPGDGLGELFLLSEDSDEIAVLSYRQER
jgi:hypothetical protein